MAARRRVVWSERALAALDEVLTYIAEESPDGARSVASEALDRAASLAALAERGRIVPELGQSTIREVFVYRYRLMYRVEAKRITVLTFIHGARDFEDWRNESDS